MAFIHNDDIAGPILKQYPQIRLRADRFSGSLQSNAAVNDGCAVPGIGTGLDKPDLQTVFFIVVFLIRARAVLLDPMAPYLK